MVRKSIKFVILPISLNQLKKIYQTYKDCLPCFMFDSNFKTVKNFKRKKAFQSMYNMFQNKVGWSKISVTVCWV